MHPANISARRMVIAATLLVAAVAAHAQYCSRDWTVQTCGSIDLVGKLVPKSATQATLLGTNSYSITTDAGETWRVVRRIETQSKCQTPENSTIYGSSSDQLRYIGNRLYDFRQLYDSLGNHVTLPYFSDNDGETWALGTDIVNFQSSKQSYKKFYVSDNVRFMISVDNYAIDRVKSTLYRSDDSGATWRAQLPHDSLSNPIFFNTREAIVETQTRGFGGNVHTLRTTDGGETWDTTIGHYLAPAYVNGKQQSVRTFMLDYSNWWIVPAAIPGTDTVWRTSDAGRTWIALGSGKSSGLADVVRDSFVHQYPAAYMAKFSINSVQFLDTQFGMCIGTEGAVFVTSDGGAHWSLANVGYRNLMDDGRCGPVQRYGMDAMYDGDSYTGMWLQDRQHAVIVSDVQLHTSDGGVSWRIAGDGCVPRKFYHAMMIDTCWGWAIADVGSLMHTTNSGATWQECSLPASIKASSKGPASADWLYAVEFRGRQFGWVGGNHGTIFRTRNGGKTWDHCDLPLGYSVVDIEFVDPANGFVLDNAGQLWNTTDAGSDWTRIRASCFAFFPDSQNIAFLQNTAPIIGMAFPTPLVGYVPNECSLYKTTDGGTTWRTLPLPVASRSNGMIARFANERWGVVSTFNESYLTRDGGETWEKRTMCDNSVPVVGADTNLIWQPSCVSTDGGATFASTPTSWMFGTIGGKYAWGANSDMNFVRWSADGTWGSSEWNVGEIAPDVRVVDFGAVAVDSQREATVVIRNVGTSLLTIGGASLAHADSSLKLALDSIFVLRPNDSAVVRILFTPSTLGVVCDTLTIASSDPLEPLCAVQIRGNGTAPTGVVGRSHQAPFTPRFVRAYPNPSASTVTIDYNCPAEVTTMLSISDALGRTTTVRDASPCIGGSFSEHVDLSSMPAGVYYLNLIVNGHRSASMQILKTERGRPAR